MRGTRRGGKIYPIFALRQELMELLDYTRLNHDIEILDLCGGATLKSGPIL